jgi:hypothetical protein
VSFQALHPDKSLIHLKIIFIIEKESGTIIYNIAEIAKVKLYDYFQYLLIAILKRLCDVNLICLDGLFP